MKILVVDDQWQLLKAIGLMLEFLELSPVLALGGRRALEQLDTASFDLILCDVQMPGMSGPDFFRMIQKKGLAEFPRFIFMSGTATPSALMEELGLEEVELLRKPFNLQSLKAALQLNRKEQGA